MGSSKNNKSINIPDADSSDAYEFLGVPKYIPNGPIKLKKEIFYDTDKQGEGYNPVGEPWWPTFTNNYMMINRYIWPYSSELRNIPIYSNIGNFIQILPISVAQENYKIFIKRLKKENKLKPSSRNPSPLLPRNISSLSSKFKTEKVTFNNICEQLVAKSLLSRRLNIIGELPDSVKRETQDAPQQNTSQNEYIDTIKHSQNIAATWRFEVRDGADASTPPPSPPRERCPLLVKDAPPPPKVREGLTTLESRVGCLTTCRILFEKLCEPGASCVHLSNLLKVMGKAKFIEKNISNIHNNKHTLVTNYTHVNENLNVLDKKKNIKKNHRVGGESSFVSNDHLNFDSVTVRKIGSQTHTHTHTHTHTIIQYSNTVYISVPK
eukprot:GHVR01155001.1.p1 GENE.GHVR01155001.1~~GHVR01155001.1.p1  ORF type:complete len:379 (+),score=116.06 GHVR01155001.1:224-1360(+)